MAEASSSVKNGTELQRTKEELKEFKTNFKLGKESEEKKPPLTTRESDPELDGLRNFHKSFNLCLLKPAQASPEKTREHRKRRKPRKPPVTKSFNEVYQLTGEVLGRGAHSSVTTCTHRSSGKEYAVKIVTKETPGSREKVLREIEILYHCRNHRNILHLVDSFEENDRFCLVFDKMKGGPLLKHIKKRERFTEREASQVVRQVTEALSFLHESGIAHRDLKPDNILCEKENKVIPVRICDFDLSSMIVMGSQHRRVTTPMLLTPVGSAEFMAPEVVDTFLGDSFSYDKKCDLWSLGVTLFMMLCGQPPFTGGCGDKCGWERGDECRKCKDLLLTRIQDGDYKFHDEEWGGISPEAKDLIGRLLEKDVKQRLSANQVLRHTWVAQEQPETPLQTPGALKRTPTAPYELSSYAASCVAFTRQLSSQQQVLEDMPISMSHDTNPRSKFKLSPPGSSELAVRRQDDPKTTQ